eukprot:8727853-Pyramimonas_sp.AAC.1
MPSKAAKPPGGGGADEAAPEIGGVDGVPMSWECAASASAVKVAGALPKGGTGGEPCRGETSCLGITGLACSASGFAS